MTSDTGSYVPQKEKPMFNHIRVIHNTDEAQQLQWIHRAMFFENITRAGLDPDEFLGHARHWWPATQNPGTHRSSVA